jgi:O-antigen biosynthesis protein
MGQQQRAVRQTRRAVDQTQRAVRILQTSGPRGFAQRVARVAHRHLDVETLEFPLHEADIADSRLLQLPLPNEGVARGRPLRVGIVSTPPSLGSGGHTTLFRMVAALEAAGHDCTLFLYDRYDGDIRRHQATIRQGWPWMRASVTDVSDVAIERVDACIASSWPTAHVMAIRAQTPMRRLYFVQDFEPQFYPRGSMQALAEDSYRFGFRCISIGHWIAKRLAYHVGIEPDVISFGCDHDVYRLEENGPRQGIVFYGKQDVPRRGYTLGMLALHEVKRRRPDVDIHVFGARHANPPFPIINHGVLTPAEIAGLYNRVVAGLVLSFTNISLVPDELLACGAVPVLNDMDNRIDIPSDQVRFAAPTPSGIAEALLGVLDAPPSPSAVAATARSEGWKPAQDEFVRVVEAETYRS